MREFAQLQWGEDHPRARTPTEESVDALSRQDVVDFHGRFFQPSSILLGVAGDVSKKEIQKKLVWLSSGVIFLLLSPDDPLQKRSESFDIFTRVYPGIVAYAEDRGVNLAIEPWPGGPPGYANLGCTPETLRAIFEEIPSPNLGICYDPSHFLRLGIDYQRLLGEFGDRVRHVHAKDTEILDDGVVFVRDGQEESIHGADHIVLAMGVESVDKLSAELEDRVAEVHVIGDAKEPKRVLEATAAAAEIRRRI